MRVPYSWLLELLPEAPEPGRLAELLDSLGLAVEAVTEYPGAARGAVSARLVSVEPLEGSAHLARAEVDDGRRRFAVLTGAPNARAGMVTAFAAPGIALPGLGAVERREMAGSVSEGVLLSPRELGVFDYGGGLVELPRDTALGLDLADEWPADTVLELELTPNRADAFSLLGVARDLAAKLGRPFRHPAAAPEAEGDAGESGLRAIVEDPAGCPRLTLRRVDGVSVGPSPAWLQRRLASVGLRPRNNVVDVTNFVTFELGQPSHAYDRRKLAEDTVLVRRAHPGERLVTLAEEELELQADDLVIATPQDGGSRPVGVAGVIGGLHGSVGPETESVVLEVAHFDPVTVRRTAKRHGISTDAHYRFERGVDPNLPPLASLRAARLIAELSGGRMRGGLTDAGHGVVRPQVRYRPSRVHFLMDFEVPRPQQARYLEALGCETRQEAEDDWLVRPPSWRFDLAIEEDLVEEVARLHGYDHVGETLPALRFTPPATDPTHRRLRLDLAGLGFTETISYVFTSPAELERAAAPAAEVFLVEPQGVERSALRTALYPNLLAAAAANLQARSLALFEVGRVFGAVEEEHLALLARGPWIEPGWREGLDLDFYLFKGLLERLAQHRNAELELRPAVAPHLHPGVGAEVLWSGRAVGSAGRLHPEVAARYELGELYLCELRLPLQPGGVRFEEIHRQPHAERDLAVLAPEAVPYAELRRLVSRSAGELLESIEPFDVYAGEQLPAGRRSVALRLRWRHPQRSLTDAEVDAFMEKVILALRAEDYDIRDR